MITGENQAETLFMPELQALQASGVDMQDLMPPGLSADRLGILHAKYWATWVNLNNMGGKSKLDPILKDQLTLAGNYNYKHFGKEGNGTFLYRPKIYDNGTCEVSLQITGAISFGVTAKGTYSSNVPNRYIEYTIGPAGDQIRIEQQGHAANLIWYPSLSLKVTTKDAFYELAWENRPT